MTNRYVVQNEGTLGIVLKAAPSGLSRSPEQGRVFLMLCGGDARNVKRTCTKGRL
jgi:hypothetical protein